MQLEYVGVNLPIEQVREIERMVREQGGTKSGYMRQFVREALERRGVVNV